MSTPTLLYDRVGDNAVTVHVDGMLNSRVLCIANSGGGKSTAIRALLEQTHGKVQQIVFDPEGEFGTLREHFSYVLAGEDGDVPAHPKVAKVLCRRLLEVGASAVLDLYALTKIERREFVKLFLQELMSLPRSLWKPLLVVIDEAHEFAPQTGEAQSTAAVNALCTQGRKRGYCAVLATQRISKLHKDAAAELNNRLIGRTAQDVDQRRAGDELGFDRAARVALRDMEPHTFWAFGPDMGNGVQLVRTAPTLTKAPSSKAIGSSAPPPNATVQSLVSQIGNLPAIANKEADERVALEAKVRELQGQLRARPQAEAPTVDVAAIESAALARGRAEGARASLNVIASFRSAMLLAVDSAASDLIDSVQLAPQIAEAAPLPKGYSAPRREIASESPRQPAAKREVGADAAISRTMRRMLSVLVQLDALGVEWAEKRTMAGWSGVSHTTGTFSNQMRGLRDSGCVEVEGDRLRITEVGRQNADDAPAIQTLDQLHSVWESKFSATVARMFVAMLELSGKRMRPVSKADLAAAVGVSHTTGTFSNQIRELRTPGVIEDVDKQHIRLTPLVFPEGLS